MMIGGFLLVVCNPSISHCSINAWRWGFYQQSQDGEPCAGMPWRVAVGYGGGRSVSSVRLASSRRWRKRGA